MKAAINTMKSNKERKTDEITPFRTRVSINSR